MFAMQIRSLPASRRFKWAVFRGRCRRNLLIGLALFVLAGLYAAWSTHRFAARSDDTRAFDRPVTMLAEPITRQPGPLRSIRPRDVTEFYLMSVISDQREALVVEKLDDFSRVLDELLNRHAARLTLPADIVGAVVGNRQSEFCGVTQGHNGVQPRLSR